MEPTDEMLLAALRSLGEGPEDVAATLLGQGCRGYRRSVLECPIAVFVVARFPGASDVIVEGGFVLVAQAEVPMPAAVAGFINDFDAGKEYTQGLAVGGSS